MACCRKKRSLPIALICPILSGNSIVGIESCSFWNDTNCDSGRQLEWYFLKNGKVIYQLPFSDLNKSVGIGQNSTYERWKFNDTNELFEYLKNLGFPFLNGDRLEIQIRIVNCFGQFSAYSNILEFTKKDCLFPWLTMTNEPFETLTGDCWEHYLIDDPLTG